jgi:hypothetical protein
MRLQQIKEDHRPIGIEEIEKHERRYLDFINDNRLRKAVEVRTAKEDRKNAKVYFKGQHHYQVLEEMNKEK